MFKYTVAYEDFNGDMQEETLYFNLSKIEMIKLDKHAPSGYNSYSDYLTAVANSNDGAKILDVYSDLLLLTYGKKSDDGKRFLKTEDIKEEFAQSVAYEQIMADMFEKPELIEQFMVGIMPKDLLAKIQQKN